MEITDPKVMEGYIQALRDITKYLEVKIKDKTEERKWLAERHGDTLDTASRIAELVELKISVEKYRKKTWCEFLEQKSKEPDAT